MHAATIVAERFSLTNNSFRMLPQVSKEATATCVGFARSWFSRKFATGAPDRTCLCCGFIEEMPGEIQPYASELSVLLWQGAFPLHTVVTEIR